MDIELKAREQLTWIKDNWVEDWEEPYRHETKYAIEDIFKILDERKAQLDSKDKEIEGLKVDNDTLINSSIIGELNKHIGKSRLAECCSYGLQAGLRLEKKLHEKDKVIELMAEHIRKIQILNSKVYDTKENIKQHFENKAKEGV